MSISNHLRRTFVIIIWQMNNSSSIDSFFGSSRDSNSQTTIYWRYKLDYYPDQFLHNNMSKKFSLNSNEIHTMGCNLMNCSLRCNNCVNNYLRLSNRTKYVCFIMSDKARFCTHCISNNFFWRRQEHLTSEMM